VNAFRRGGLKPGKSPVVVVVWLKSDAQAGDIHAIQLHSPDYAYGPVTHTTSS
jgi:hypothetical protein